MREEAEKAKNDAVKESTISHFEVNEKEAKRFENEETNDAAKAAHENEIDKNEIRINDDNDMVYVDEREEKSRRNEMTFMLRSNELETAKARNEFRELHEKNDAKSMVKAFENDKQLKQATGKGL